MNADLGGENSGWLIMEDSFTAALANTYETLFTSSNGYLGTRGSLEEGHEGALPGTFLRGVFDYHDSAVTDLVKGTRLAEFGRRGQRHQAGRDVGISRPPPASTRHAGGHGVPRHRVRGR